MEPFEGKKSKLGLEKEKETDRRLKPFELREAAPPKIGGSGSSRVKNSPELKMKSSSQWKMKHSPKVGMKNSSKLEMKPSPKVETKSAALKYGAGTSAIPSLPSPSRKRRGPGHR